MASHDDVLAVGGGAKLPQPKKKSRRDPTRDLAGGFEGAADLEWDAAARLASLDAAVARSREEEDGFALARRAHGPAGAKAAAAAAKSVRDAKADKAVARLSTPRDHKEKDKEASSAKSKGGGGGAPTASKAGSSTTSKGGGADKRADKSEATTTSKVKASKEAAAKPATKKTKA